MPDITMCANNNECPKKDTCYRDLARPSNWQSYSTFFKGHKKCGHYWEIIPESKAFKEIKWKK